MPSTDSRETDWDAATRRYLFRRDADAKLLDAIQTIAAAADELAKLRRDLDRERKRRAEVWAERNRLADRVAELEGRNQ